MLKRSLIVLSLVLVVMVLIGIVVGGSLAIVYLVSLLEP